MVFMPRRPEKGVFSAPSWGGSLSVFYRRRVKKVAVGIFFARSCFFSSGERIKHFYSTEVHFYSTETSMLKWAVFVDIARNMTGNDLKSTDGVINDLINHHWVFNLSRERPLIRDMVKIARFASFLNHRTSMGVVLRFWRPKTLQLDTHWHFGIRASARSVFAIVRSRDRSNLNYLIGWPSEKSVN